MGKKIMTAALAVLLFTAVITAVASATTIWVPEGGNQMIQQAVNNATAGDTIIVRDGTYNENVDVGMAHLTIRSQNGSANCIVAAASSDDHVFDVQQDYVNISGFTVKDATGGDMAGIYLSGREHCSISDNNALNSWYGISLQSSSDNTLTSNTANSNNVVGIHLSGSSNNNTLTGNTANSNNDYGILSGSSNNNTLTGNNASNNYNGICLSSSSNNTLTGNNASNNNYGIRLFSSSNNTLTGNTANSNSRHGIDLYDSSYNNVSCNWVQNNTVAGFRLRVKDVSTGNTIENNNIIANGDYNDTSGGYEWQFENAQSDEVSTAGNWWGTNNETRIDASIHDWTYDTDWGNVTTSPRLDGPAPCAPIPELSTVLLFAVGLLMLVGYVRIGRRKT